MAKQRRFVRNLFHRHRRYSASRRFRLCAVYECLEPRLLLSASFGPQKLISDAAMGAKAVYAADLDGDGHNDVLSASERDDKIAWYRNEGDGSFGDEQIITNTADEAEFVYAADLDNDGALDVLSASGGDDTIAWYRNLGGGQFGAQQVISQSANFANYVYAADLDNDEDLDVISASKHDNKIAWYKNDGSGKFSDENVITTEASWARSVDVADLDNDGDLDVLSASERDSTIAWYRNEGDGSFEGRVIITSSVPWCVSVRAADIDGDGLIDVVSDDVAWYPNEGHGKFGTREPIYLASDVVAVYAVDLDNDNDIDVISASVLADEIGWHENRGGGQFEPRQIITSDVNYPRFLHAADLDGDGDVDVLSSSTLDDKVAWYEHLGSPNEPPAPIEEDVTTDEDTDQVITLDGTDADGDTLTATVTSLPEAGQLFQTPDGVIRGDQITAPETLVTDSQRRVIFTPVTDENGSPYTTFAFTVNDGQTDSTEAALVTVNVTVVNDPPKANPDEATVAEDGSVVIAVLSNDTKGPANEDNQKLRVTSASALHGMATTNGTTVTYAPDADYSGADTISYTITDDGTTNGVADPLTDNSEVAVTVSEVNDAPTVAVDNYLPIHGNGGGFGRRVAVVDDEVMVGAILQNGREGTAYLYHVGNIDHRQTFPSLDPQDDHFNETHEPLPAPAEFGSDILATPDYWFVGAMRANRVWMIERATGNLLDVIHHPSYPNPVGEARFGHSLAMVNDKLVVGAPYENRVYVYHVDTHEKKATLENGFLKNKIGDEQFVANAGSQFGWDVAAVGDHILVGAPVGFTGDVRAGAAFLFDGSTGNLITSFENPTPDPFDHFGYALAASGDNVVITAPYNNGNSGIAYAFDVQDAIENPETPPEPLQPLLHNPNHLGSAAGDLFGFDVVAVGNRIAVSARDEDGVARPAGAVYLFEASSLLVEEVIPNPEESPTYAGTFGVSVAADARRLVVGAYHDESGPGAAYVYDLDGPPDVDEGDTTSNSGTFEDIDLGDDVTITASIGTVTQVGTQRGTWNWSFDTTDGPGDSQTVTITATDSDGATGTTTFALTVDNVAPSVVLDDMSDILENGTAVLSGTITDIGRLDSHDVRVDWDDGNDLADSTFELDPIFSINAADGSLTQELLEGETFNSTNAADPGTLLTVDTVDTATGVITFTVSHQYLDDGHAPGNNTAADTSNILVTVSDDDTGVGSDVEPVLVENVPPVMESLFDSSPGCGCESLNREVTIVGSFSDIGTVDEHDVTVDWDDTAADSTFALGITSSLTVGATFNSSTDAAVLTVTEIDGQEVTFEVSHTYATGGIFEILVTVDDDDLGSDDATTTVTVNGVRLKDGVLQIVGTPGRDDVDIDGEGGEGAEGGGLITLKTKFDKTGFCDGGEGAEGGEGKFFFDVADVTSILIHLCEGDDDAKINQKVSLPATVYAGEGDDKVKGGSGDDLIFGEGGEDQLEGGEGNDVLDGGDGDDKLKGEKGRDVLIGGAGADDVESGEGGEGGGDLIGGILIGGWTDFDPYTEFGLNAMKEIRDELAAATVYDDLVAELTKDGGLLDPVGINRTVFGDGEEDKLHGSNKARDLFFADLFDKVKGDKDDDVAELPWP